MSIIDAYEADRLYDIDAKAKEWAEARLAVTRSVIGSPECHEAIKRLGNAEDALSKTVRRT